MVRSNLTESELEKLALAQHLNPNQVFPYLLQVPEFKAQYSSLDKPEESQYILLPQHNLYVAKERTLHGKNWYECHVELHKQNSRMLTLREFADFLLLLKSGKAEDGLKNKISKSGKHMEKAQEFFDRIEVLNINKETAFKSAEIGAELIKTGNEINTEDLLIAGAILNEECKTIITNDPDFKKIKELNVETY